MKGQNMLTNHYFPDLCCRLDSTIKASCLIVLLVFFTVFTNVWDQEAISNINGIKATDTTLSIKGTAIEEACEFKTVC